MPGAGFKDKTGGCFVKNSKGKIIIAIDGTSGSGKSTLAKLIAKELSFDMLNTGLLYREITRSCLENNVNKENIDEIIRLATDFDFHQGIEGLHSENISQMVPFISRIPAVRDEVTKIQKKIAKNKNIVIEGRDIGTVVFPKADYKIFITASIEERAKRRHRQIQQIENVDLEEIMKNIETRDFNDAHRMESPLRIPKDAYILDTTGKTVPDTLKEVFEHLNFSINRQWPL